MTEKKDEIFSDIDNLYDQLLLLDLTLNKCSECHNEDQQLIKELTVLCEERAMIMNAQQISINNMDTIIDQLHSQYEKTLNEGVEKTSLLTKLAALQEENFMIREQFCKEKKELEENYSKTIIKYEIKIEELIKQNEAKEYDRIKCHEEMVTIKDTEIENLKQEIELNHQKMMKEKIQMKEDFERKGEEYKSQLQLLNSFSSNVSNDFYKKKYEFMQVESERKINALTMQLNFFISGDNRRKRLDFESPKAVHYYHNDNSSQIGKNTSDFVASASLLEENSPRQSYKCLSERTSMRAQNLKIKSIQDSSLFCNEYKSNFDEVMHNTNSPKCHKTVPQKRKLFSINSVNCLE